MKRGRKPTLFTDEELTTINKLRFDDRVALSVIAKHFGVCTYTIQKIVGKTGHIAYTDPQLGLSGINRSERIERIKHLRFIEKKSLIEIAKEFNISKQRINQILGNTTLPKVEPASKETREKTKTLRTNVRFWLRVNIGGIDECWEWTGYKDPNGYGRLLGGQYAHHFAFSMIFGQAKNHVLHRCDNPSCVNPMHLYDGTPKENMRDRDIRQRHLKSKRFTDEEVISLRKAHFHDGISISELCKQHNTNYAVMHRMINNHSYKQIK